MASGDVSVVASTISATSEGSGGGFYLDGSNASNSERATVASNQADANADDVAAAAAFLDDGLAIFYNSILGNNSLARVRASPMRRGIAPSTP